MNEITLTPEQIAEADQKINLHRGEAFQSVFESSRSPSDWECMAFNRATFGDRVKEATQPCFDILRRFGGDPIEAARRIIAKAKLSGQTIEIVLRGTAHKMSIDSARRAKA